MPAPIGVDAMGGDRAPGVAAEASRLLGTDVPHLLVGDPQCLVGVAATVHPARDRIAMDEDVVKAVRAKAESSIRVGARLLAAGQVAALVSAGSTGATLAAARLDVGRLGGVRQPVLAARVPVADGRWLVLLDAGAVPRARTRELIEHARLGAAYARALGVTEPRVGLLNVASEPGKGPRALRAAAAALDAEEGFVGPVEPGRALAGGVDVLVTDGFSGNVMLKTMEALRPARVGVRPGQQDDGGIDGGTGDDHAALVVGVAAPVLVAHGAVDAQGLAGAVRFAAEIVRGRVIEQMAERLDGR